MKKWISQLFCKHYTTKTVWKSVKGNMLGENLIVCKDCGKTVYKWKI